MAADITASLRAIDPNDPVKFDFSHLPPWHDERLRIREGHGRCAVPAQGRLSPGEAQS